MLFTQEAVEKGKKAFDSARTDERQADRSSSNLKEKQNDQQLSPKRSRIEICTHENATRRREDSRSDHPVREGKCSRRTISPSASSRGETKERTYIDRLRQMTEKAPNCCPRGL